MNLKQYQENTIMAMGALRSHKMMSFLTVLGVIIGVLTVIVIASILTGMRQSIVNLVEEFGTDNIYAFHLTTGPQFGPMDREEWQREPLTTEDADVIKRDVDNIEHVSYQGFFWDSLSVQYKKESFRQSQLQGVSPNHALVTNIVIEEGRFFSRVDDLRRNSVCVIGVDIAEALFPHVSTIAGRKIRINGNQFTVIGVLEKRKATVFGSGEEDRLILIPYRTFQKIAPKMDFLMIIAQAKQGQRVKALSEIEAVLRRQRGVRYNEDNDFDLTTSDRLIEQFDSITSTIGLVAIAISGVGLLVGGIGVMNIMLVSVTERTREIGIRKAIGAKRQDIVVQFLFEAITLSTSGGIIGILLAILTSWILVEFVPSLPASIPIWAVVTGFTVSVSVGLVFGVFPAIQASSLDPIESLHYE